MVRTRAIVSQHLGGLAADEQPAVVKAAGNCEDQRNRVGGGGQRRGDDYAKGGHGLTRRPTNSPQYCSGHNHRDVFMEAVQGSDTHVPGRIRPQRYNFSIDRSIPRMAGKYYDTSFPREE